MKHLTVWCLALLICSTASANAFNFLTDFDPAPKLTVTGQVFCAKSKNPIASSILVAVDETEPIHLEATASSKFTTSVPTGGRIKILAEAEGYESNELIYSIPTIKSDTTVFVQIFL